MWQVQLLDNRLRSIGRLLVYPLLASCVAEDVATPPLVTDGTSVLFEVEPTEPGTIATVTALSTYVGGSATEIARDVDVDAQGNIYVTGGTTSADFPVTAAAFDRTFNNPGTTAEDVFIQKRGPNGQVIWSTYLGGRGFDRAYAIEVDANGFVYVAGRAGAGFPVTAGAMQTVFAGGGTSSLYGTQDGFVCKLRPDGAAIVYCTYFGNDDAVPVRDIAIDGNGSVYLATSSDRGVLPSAWFTNAYQKTRRGRRDMLIAKLNASGSAIVWATYVGGSGDELNTNSIGLDSGGNVYAVTTSNSADAPTPNGFDHTLGGPGDIYLVKLSATGSQLLYGTFVGGSSNDFTETHNLAVTPAGHAVVAGMTRSSDLQGVANGFLRTLQGLATTTGNGQGGNYSGDGMIVRVAADGRLVAATYVGGRYGDGIEGVNVNSLGEVHVSGTTYSNNFSTTTGVLLRGGSDMFVARLTPALNALLFATTLGGSAAESGRSSILDAAGNVVAVGTTASSNLPLTNATQTTRRGPTDGLVYRARPSSN